ncbi:MAG: transposase [Thermoflexus sp.]
MTKKESRYKIVAKIAYQLAQEVLPSYSHPKSPHLYTLPQLAACVLLTFYLNLSYRDMEEWLRATDQVCAALELKRVPDHTTIWRAYRRLLRMKVLNQMLERLLNWMEVQEEVIAVDSTGYALSPASAYYRSRTGRTMRAFWKGVYAVGTDSQFILAWRQGPGPGNDSVFLNGLRRDVRRYARKGGWTILGDAGFDGQGVTERDLIPPIRRGGRLVDPKRRARAELVAAARLDGLYGQRWKSETVNSVIKRKFGDALRSRSPILRRRESAIKGLVYNLHR